MAHRTIDTRKPITLYDDRNQSGADLMATHVLYENEQVILVMVQVYHFNRQGLLVIVRDKEPEHLLILRDGGYVQNSDYDSWIAENPAETRVPAPVLGNPAA